MLTRFSRQGISEVKTGISYINIPQDRILAESNIDSLSFTLQANKFEAIYYRLKRPKINVDVSSYLKPSKKNVVLDKQTLEGLIINQIDENLTVRNVSINELEIKLNAIDTKKVPVIAKTSISLKKGFDVVGVPSIVPDSVILSGPQKMLDSISEMSTILFQRDEIDTSLQVKIPLEPIVLNDINVKETSISYSMQVEEFSQKIVTVPVKLLNAPRNETIKMIPSTIKIDFVVSLSLFNEIMASDFVVVCDYAKRNEDENFMIPEITTAPKGIKDAELISKKIDFLIFK